MSDELKAKIMNWLMEEGYSVLQKTQDKADFWLVATVQGFEVSIVSPSNTKSIIIGNEILLGEDIINVYNPMPKKDKITFCYPIVRETALLCVAFSLLPNLENPKSVKFTHTVYDEEISKKSLMESIVKISSAILITKTRITEKFGEIDKNTNNLPGLG